MPRYVEVGTTYAGGFIGKGLSRLYKEVDTRLGREALPVYQRIRTWADIGTGIGCGVVAALYGDRLGSIPYHILLGMGTVTVANALDYAEEAVTGLAPYRGAPPAYEAEGYGQVTPIVTVKRVH